MYCGNDNKASHPADPGDPTTTAPDKQRGSLARATMWELIMR